MSVRLPAFTLISDVGLIRSENQDRAVAVQVAKLRPGSPSFTCLAVSDGMGGMFAGEACAIITLSSFVSGLLSAHRLSAIERLQAAARAANSAVYAFAQGKGGATLSAVLVEETGRSWHVNVGDSRVYIVSEARQKLDRVTVDDTLQEAFGGHGRELVQFVGIGPALLPRVGELPRDADQVFITSDGAHYFSPELLEQLILRAGEPRRAAERIVAVSRWLGGPDNATVAAFRPGDLIGSQSGSNHAVRVWTPSETTTIVLLPMVPSRNDGDSVEDAASARPRTAVRANTRRQSKGRSPRKREERRPEGPQPELLVTLSADEPPDAADS